jgi:hypothetical protein
MNQNEQPISPDISKLKTLGKEGKLWSLTVVYDVDGVTKQLTRRNMTGEQLMAFRKTMFNAGFTLMVEPGHWKIVCPMDIKTADCYQQRDYFPDGDSFNVTLDLA